MNDTDKEFADSSNNSTFYDNPALNTATQSLFRILDETPPKPGPVKPALAKLLREVQTNQLFAGERDEDGKQLFKTFAAWVKSAQRIYVGLSDGSNGSKGDRYKHVPEALCYNRLEDAKFTVLPIQRSVLKKVCSVKPELQVDAWEKTLKDAGSKTITPMDVAAAAIALGDDEVALPPPTASTKMPVIQQTWHNFKAAVQIEFGPSIERHFPPMDKLLVKKSKKSEAAVNLAPPEDGGDAGSDATQGTQEKNHSQDEATDAVTANSAAPGAKETPTISILPVEGEKTENVPNTATSTIDQIVDRMEANLTSGAAQTDAATQESEPEPDASHTAADTKSQKPAEKDSVRSTAMRSEENERMATSDTPPYDRFILDTANGHFERMRTAQRPWVTAFAGTVLIGFASPEQMKARVKAGFPSPRPIYDWRGGKFGGVWEHLGKLDGTQQLAEVRRIAEHLAKTHAPEEKQPMAKTT